MYILYIHVYLDVDVFNCPLFSLTSDAIKSDMTFVPLNSDGKPVELESNGVSRGDGDTTSCSYGSCMNLNTPDTQSNCSIQNALNIPTRHNLTPNVHNYPNCSGSLPPCIVRLFVVLTFLLYSRFDLNKIKANNLDWAMN